MSECIQSITAQPHCSLHLPERGSGEAGADLPGSMVMIMVQSCAWGGLDWSGRVFKECNKNLPGEVVSAHSLSVFRSHLENVLINVF